MKQESLNRNSIYAIAVGDYFEKTKEACYMVYAPLSNSFFLSTSDEVERLEKEAESGNFGDTLQKITIPNDTQIEGNGNDISTDTFLTLHLLLNEKCNFKCSYCYSAEGRSNKELGMETIEPMLRHFLSAERHAQKERTITFMGGGEPTLSWTLLQKSTEMAEEIAEAEGITLHLTLTTNGSLLTSDMIAYLKKHNFLVQISFEVLPDVQRAQRGPYEKVAENINKLCDAEVNVFVRTTITEMNVERMCEMVEHCHREFPKLKKLSCQQVVDKEYFANTDIVHAFFKKYFDEYNRAVVLAKSLNIDLRSSASHLIKYSRRERFCYNVLCLTPYGTLTTCPDVSSPQEEGYASVLIGEVGSDVRFDEKAFERVKRDSIHTVDKCRQCWAKWNCGSGCPSSRQVYRPEIFDAICDYYRGTLRHTLMQALCERYKKSTGKDMIEDIKKKL